MSLDIPELFTIDLLLDRFPHLSRDTVYDWLLSGELHGFKLGRVWHIHPDDWTDFVDRRRQQVAQFDAAADDDDAPPPSVRRRDRQQAS